MASDNKIKTGILLLNLGGPDSLRSVRPFLFNLFSDRDIIRLGPSFMQKPLAWLISSLRSAKTESFYKMIGGKSPIYDMTLAQAKAMEEEINMLGVRSKEFIIKAPSPVPLPIGQAGSPSRGEGYIISPLLRGGDEGEGDVCGFTNELIRVKVYLAMRYWHPLIEDVIPEIYKAGIKRLIVLSLYPQYSVATTGSSFSKLDKVISKYPMEIFSIKSWYDYPLYIDALVEKIRKGIDAFKDSNELCVMGNGLKEEKNIESNASRITHHALPPDVHVLFSAHSLPVKFIEEGDPYVEQINGTIREVVKKLDIQWSLSYQSKSGPVKWLEPSTEKKLEELAGKGIKNLLVVPISFVSDHIETLYEIDILYKNMAETLGMRLERTESLNISPLFISALCDIVKAGMKETGWQE